MKKSLLVLLIMLAGFTSLSQATEEYWVDVNFTRDSTAWKAALPALAPNGENMQVSVMGSYLGFNIKGAFGKFAPPSAVYQPVNSENANERFFYAFRINRAANVYWAFPEVSNAAKIKVHVQCGSDVDPGEFTLQKNTSTVEGVETWEEFNPVIKFTVPGHANLTTDVVIEKELNITTPVKLRFLSLGTVTKNVHLYAVTISKTTSSGISQNTMDGITVNLIGRSLQVANGGMDVQASIYNLSGVHIGNIQRGEPFNLPVAGSYILRIKTAEGIVTKKIVAL